jgi:hypothetical protein
MNEPQARTDGLIREAVDDELVVYDTVSNVAHALSRQANQVWELCDGTRSPAVIARDLEIAESLVRTTLDELGRCGLLDQPESDPSRLSRREVGLRFAKAAALGPLIYSVAIPASAAAASPGICPTGVAPAGATCLQGGSATSPSGSPVTAGNAGYSTSCPIVAGNAANQNCYVTGGSNPGKIVCTGTNCVRFNAGGCSQTPPAACCAGIACCTVPLGGGFTCSQ